MFLLQFFKDHFISNIRKNIFNYLIIIIIIIVFKLFYFLKGINQRHNAVIIQTLINYPFFTCYKWRDLANLNKSLSATTIVL